MPDGISLMPPHVPAFQAGTRARRAPHDVKSWVSTQKAVANATARRRSVRKLYGKASRLHT